MYEALPLIDSGCYYPFVQLAPERLSGCLYSQSSLIKLRATLESKVPLFKTRTDGALVVNQQLVSDVSYNQIWEFFQFRLVIIIVLFICHVSAFLLVYIRPVKKHFDCL